MHILEKKVGQRRYRVAAQAVWDPVRGRSFSRQAVLGPADLPPVADLGALRTVGTARIGDVGALAWVAEQLDVIRVLDQACGVAPAPKTPSLGEMVLAVAVQRACAPGSKQHLGDFLKDSLARVSCLPGGAFTGQVFHRWAARVTDEQLARAQIELARRATERFALSVSVLAFDTTNFDTHIATTTPGLLARRGHAKSKRADLRVVGLGVLVSETGQVPLLHRTYAGNGADQTVLTSCLDALGQLHDALDRAEGRTRSAPRTLVRDGGSWGEDLEHLLDVVGYYTLVSLPLGHGAAERALVHAAQRGAMKPLTGALRGVRAARLRGPVGALDRTLVVVESEDLLRGQKRGIAAALAKAKAELGVLARRIKAGRIRREDVRRRVQRTLAREHLAAFVVADVGGTEARPTLVWHVDAAKRRALERQRLGRRVLCTDQHDWTTARIVTAFRGQWHVEELFRRTKKGGVVPWGPSYQWADGSLRLHTFATVLGLMLVSLAKLALGSSLSVRGTMTALAGVRATRVRVAGQTRGRPPTVLVPPELSPLQADAVRTFDLERWMPTLRSTRTSRRVRRENSRAA